MPSTTISKTKLIGKEPSLGRSIPKYRDLALRLRAEIVKGQLKPGDRLPSFPQMHREWGVTQKTAEQAYALLEKEGLIFRRTGSGVYVSDAKQPAATGVIAIANGFPAQHPYFLSLLNGVQAAARERKTEVLLLHDNSLIGWDKVDGVLSCDPYPGHFTYRLPHDMPHVSLLHPLDNTVCVITDDRAAMSRAVAYLVELGHRRIGYLTMSHHIPEGLGVRRLEGYRDGLKEAGIQLQERWLRPVVKPLHLEFDNRKFGYHAMKQWLEDDWEELGCTAVLAHNDEAALGALDALQAAGKKAPDDVSIVGFDGIGLTHPISGSITSISVPLYEIGEQGANLLIDITQQPLARGPKLNTPPVIELPAHMQPGDSTAKLKTRKTK